MKKNEQESRLQPVAQSQRGTRSQAEAQRLAAEEETQIMPIVPQSVDKTVVQLRAEELVPTKEWVESGALLVRKGVEVYPQTIPVEVLHEEVSVERVPMNRVLAEGEVAAPWQDGDVMVIPVVQEELVVVKRLVVREEIRVSKVRVPTTQNISENVRRETISLETTGNVRVLPGQSNSPDGHQ